MTVLKKILAPLLLVCSVQCAVYANAPADSVLATLIKTHPRLIATGADFDRVAANKETDPYLKEAFQKIYERGEKMMADPISTFVIPDGLRLLATSRMVVYRVSTLAFLFRTTKEKKFAERAWKELYAASQFPNWNPKHFLDVGEMTFAFALGYDWLFDYWNDDQKRIIKSAIIEKGLSRALLAYEKLGIQNESWWTDVPHNWNQVCNGGIGVGALSIADEEPRLSERILKHVIQRLPLAMKHFAPDGAWNEGPGYWSYATMYNVAIVSSLKTALNNDFGLSDMEGFSKTGLFPVYNNSPIDKSFNYADGGDERIAAAQLYWFAKRFDQPSVASYLFQYKPADPFALLWYDPALLHANKPLPPDFYFREAEVVTMRSKWNDSLATFVACKAGDNKANHSHLDVGTYILDALGERWIFDLGADNYNIPGYFGSGAKGQRWTYYRTRAEGHNTLVIDSNAGPDQDPMAATKMIDFKTGPASAFTIMDLTPAYASRSTSVKRGIALAENRQSVVVNDEITNIKPTDIFWFAHTKAAIALSSNKKSAVLNLHGKRYVATIVSPANAVFNAVPAEPLPGSPHPKENNPNKGVQKLSIHLSAVANANIVVIFHTQKGPVKSSFTKGLETWP